MIGSKFIAGILTAATLLTPIGGVFAVNEVIGEGNKEIETTFEAEGGTLEWKFSGDNKNKISFENIKISEASVKGIQGNSNMPKITVVDNRGSLEGYKVMVKAEKLTNGSHKLKEGTLRLKMDGLKNARVGGTEENNDLEVDINKFVKESGYINLDAGNKSLFTIESGDGFGTIDYNFNENALNLNVHQKDVRQGLYKTNIVFTLQYSPNA